MDRREISVVVLAGDGVSRTLSETLLDVKIESNQAIVSSFDRRWIFYRVCTKNELCKKK